MDAKDSIEHFETSHNHAGLDDPDLRGFVRTAAIVVAVLAAILAVSTFLAEDASKHAITGEVQAADASARLEANDIKTTAAKHDATLLRVIGAGAPSDRRAAQQAAALDAQISTHYAPIDARLRREIVSDGVERDHADQQHLLFEIAAVGLQIAIVLSSISIIARRRWLLSSGGALGLIASGVLVAGLLA